MGRIGVWLAASALAVAALAVGAALRFGALAAPAPKELWVIAGAAHDDFNAYAPAEYERRVIGFLEARLSTRGNPALAPN